MKAANIMDVNEASQSSPKTFKNFLYPSLFTLTAFVGASLVFMIQPLVAKVLLPHFGGASTLWATSSLFFQSLLLISYFIVHYTSRFTHRIQGLILTAIGVLAIFSLPISFQNAGEMNPILKVIVTLSLMVGLPYLLLATTGPLIQRWYSLSTLPRAEDPYFLYSASNLGSFVGLLSYPFILERLLTVQGQSILWTTSFIIFLIMLIICGFIVSKMKTKPMKVSPLFKSDESFKQKLYWVLLAFIPSSLMLGLTTFITTDVGSFPLLWVIPLALYLFTMMLAFAQSKRSIPNWQLAIATLTAICLLLMGLSYYGFSDNLLITLSVHLAGYFIIAYVVHSKLAAGRPNAESLTSFYVFVSIGGALGGLFNGFLAPTIFNSSIEYLLVLMLVPIALLARGKTVPILTALLLISIYPLSTKDFAIYSSRTFYSSYHVTEIGNMRKFFSGTTLHGSQNSDNPLKTTTYYAGALEEIYQTAPHQHTTAVGLGAGTLAALHKAGDILKFYEIDEEVETIARKYFTYLSDSKADVTVEIMDGRLGIGSSAPKSQDLIVLDAFASDSIPLHLVTKDAFENYWRAVKDDGVIAIHISNRFYDLAPVIQANANALDTSMLYRRLAPSGEPEARWLVLTKNSQTVERLQEKGWLLTDLKPTLWTDDFTSPLQAFIGFNNE